KSFKNVKNLMYRTYQNENLIILKGDNNNFIMGVIQDSKDPLNDFIGIGSTFEPLIKLFEPLIRGVWETAYPDSFHATQLAQTSKTTTPTKTLTSVKPIISAEFQRVEKKPKEIKDQETKPTISIPGQIQEIPKGDIRFTESPAIQTQVTTPSKSQITNLKQKLKEKIDFMTVAQPTAGDESAIEINTAFTNLIQKLDNLKGEQFGKELQDIADLILEKKGFSVTLHKVRSTINKYKEKFSLLDENDKKEIIENIENWKQKLF
ncbi:MAG: hypothetical protein ACFFDN_25610, partial [Candidatus Hodarchaeota archaeon]